MSTSNDISILHCTCKVGPGKFEGEPPLTFLAWQSVLNGGSDESVGPYEFFRRPYGFDTPQAVQAALDYGYCAACIAGYDNGSYGLTIEEGEQGFVYLTTYATEKRYLEASELRAQEQEEEEQGEEDE